MRKYPLHIGEMPLFKGKASAMQRGNFRARDVLEKAQFIGKAVALQRGNFGALIYVIHMR